MIQPTDRLFLRSRESRAKARTWASFIRNEVDRLKLAGIPVHSAYFQREDFGLRLIYDPVNCIRRGIVNIPENVDPQEINDISHCFFEGDPSVGTNYKAGVEYTLLIGKPMGPALAEIPGETKNQFEIYYQLGAHPRPFDGLGVMGIVVEKTLFPSFARVR